MKAHEFSRVLGVQDLVGNVKPLVQTLCIVGNRFTVASFRIVHIRLIRGPKTGRLIALTRIDE